MKARKVFGAYLSIGVSLGFTLPILSAEKSFSEKQGKSKNDAKLVGGVSDGRLSPPVPKKPLPKYEVERTQTHHKNGQKVVINRVKKPSETPQRVIPAQAPAAQRSIAPEIQRESKPHGGFFTVSATVYDHRATLVRWSHNGEEFSIWSNLDWNHLGGVISFEGRGKEYSMMLLSSNISLRKLRQQHGKGEKVDIPQIPELPPLSKRGASYMLIKGDETHHEAMEFIEAVHDLYDAERVRLVRAYHERERNRLTREKEEAALRKNPPPKKDAVINYWRKNQPPNKKVK